MTSGKPGAARPPLTGGNRSFWLKHLHQWHWISSALCLIGMLLFAATGITLNHAGQIPATPHVQTRTATAPAALLAQLPLTPQDEKRVLPPELRAWISQAFGVTAGENEADWSSSEIYLPLPRPGGDGWLNLDRETGEATLEVTTRGWVSYLNDLHKGRHAGLAWSWFLDLFAVACLVFCLTGLFLLHLHARARPTTWPMVGLGLVIPVILAILFIH
ncbi:MAG: hypothetical protein JWR10_73 [Rubritepida sp.]|nr:hypothetical protein [Rubritepida sp.]